MSYLQKATAQDSVQIQQLAQRVWPVTFGNILSATQIDYMLDMMYAPAAIEEQMKRGHIFHLLHDADAERIGYVSHQLDYLPQTTKIHKLYVLPERQGEGWGKFLIQAVAQWARQSDQQKLRLDVNYQNQAVGFYHHLGFQTIDRVNTEIGNGYLMEDYVMEMPL
jgi:GNAT superfamily N-acetyltransferase